MLKKVSFGLLLGLACLNLGASAQVLNSRQIDSLAEKTLRTFNVPGIAVGIVKDGKLIHAKGYGVRSIKTGRKVDENTLFGVASNTKAFTAAALGMLVDQKKISWDSRVTDIIPEFKLYDPFVTNEFTIKDLLTHRSGLGLGAGDLMIWPDSSTVTKKQMIHNLRYLKPVSSFRTKYDYDNLLYIVAGDVVARVSGLTYEDFIESQIIRPLGMTKTAASWYRLKDRSNIIDGHAPADGKLVPVGLSFTELANAAGGMYSNITDMSKWVIAQIEQGKYDDGKKRLFSAEVHREMWSPQTIINGSSPYNTHFSAYGLGWFLSDVNGYFQATHTGGLAGIVTQVTILPELKLGIIVLTNQQSGAAFTAISNSIKDGYFGIKGKDRIKQYNDARLKNEQEAAAITTRVQQEIAAAEKTGQRAEPAVYAGKFRDNWFGDIEISQKSGHLYFKSVNSPKLRGDMYFYKANTWLVKWQDRSLDADAFVIYQLDAQGKPSGIKMEAISPLTDFSFDFQDLDFKPQTTNK
ncbi:serine hydrolase [Pedobacter sp. SYP-B3415]|uniref:serine hydrolase n=1 Tax=Pedobacter sp. SYP-B3415 TaxID=2496641 RepID=UPI00101D0A54|nr:serine hydrolase [Pedobacter sp. SYP-B3415]